MANRMTHHAIDPNAEDPFVGKPRGVPGPLTYTAL